MQFKERETTKCCCLTVELNAKQMQELPKYYIWLVSTHGKPENEKVKEKYSELHQSTIRLSKLIKRHVQKYTISVYVYNYDSHQHKLIYAVRKCQNLRQLLTLYLTKSGIMPILYVEPLKGAQHLIGKKHHIKTEPHRHVNVAITPITKAKSIHGKYAVEAPRLDIHTIQDALLFFPNDNHFQTIDEYVSGHHFTHHQNIAFKDGQLLSIDIYRTSRLGKQKCRNGAMRYYFHAVPAEDKTALKTSKQLYHDRRGFFVNMFDIGGNEVKAINNAEFYQLKGTWNSRFKNVTVSETDGHEKGDIQPYHGTKITTIGKYTQKTGVPEKDIQHMMKLVVPNYAQDIKELAPMSAVKEHSLMPRGEAIFNCHFPGDDSLHQLGVKSEKYQELYQYAYKLARLHQKRSRKTGFAIHADKNKLLAFRRSLPYELTRDQNGAVKDILYDLGKPYQMARLLQGDVGSGKTVVAAFAILAVISAGYQAAIMIPTTVLGGQHYQTFTSMFKGLGIHIALLTGKTSSHDKRIILKKLAKGNINLIIGTEALYTQGTKYEKLGLVVIDEQHRFGVHQRKALEDKTQGCNVLSMTATPIPRTLATAMYNAMDVSQIRTMPKGRKPIKTKWLHSKQATPAYLKQVITQRVKEGGQTFVIAKLVKKSHNPKMKNVSNAKETYKKMKSIFAGTNINVACITGQMDDDDKDEILAGFSDDKYQVLVATSVVEVGVDIPKANMMVILDSDRYGLAQLHQLRGRVGRNSLQAYCLLVADPKTTTGVKRMKVMEKNTSGFRVADEDLKLRGGGNIFGNAQHGLPDFPLADLGNADDVQLMQIASQDATRELRKD